MPIPARHLLIPAALLSLACQTAGPDSLDPAHATALSDSVRDMAAAITRDLEREGPTAWLSYFLDGREFFMVSDGRVVFPSIDSATSFVRGFDRRIASMELVWEDVRIDPLSPGAAVLGASYREVLTDTSGAESRFEGYMTSIAVHTASGWRLRDLHWSSSAPPETP